MSMTPQESATFRLWLERCVASLEASSATQERNTALGILNERIQQTATNVIPFRRAA